MKLSNTMWSVEKSTSEVNLEINRYFGKSKIIFFSNKKYCLMDAWNNLGIELYDYKVEKEVLILRNENQEIEFELNEFDSNNIKLSSHGGVIELARTEQLDIQGNLRNYFPAIFQLLGDITLDWNSIQNKFESRLYDRMFLFLSSESGFSKEYELSFFDSIQMARSGDRGVLLQIKYLNDIIVDLINSLDNSEMKLVKNTMYNILIEQDKKFKNYIGELAILHRLKTQGYYLSGNEIPLFEGGNKNTKIDFEFKKDNSVYYVEVRSLHLTSANTSSDFDMSRLLNKITEKFIEKGNNPLKLYWVYPVIWGQFDEISKLNEFMKRNNISIERSFPPAALMIYSHPDNENVMMYKFASIAEIVKPHPVD